MKNTVIDVDSGDTWKTRKTTTVAGGGMEN